MSEVDPIGSVEGSANDTVSINSTIPSEPREEYPLERVFAERINGGIKEFLVKWEGYPEERCTWETQSNFQDDDTLHLWQARKMRIAKGLDKPYDVDALEVRVEAWIAATESRKARRRIKRRRLGLSITSKETSEESSDEAEEVPLDRPRRAQNSRQGVGKSKSNKPAAGSSDDALTDDSLMEDLHTRAFNEQHKRIQRRTGPRGDKTVKKDSSEREPPKRSEKREPPVKQRSTIPTANLSRKVATSPALYAGATLKKGPKPEGSQMGTAGHGPARLSQKVSGPKARPKVSGAAVLGNWAAKVKPRKLPEPQPRRPSVGGPQPETFNRWSTKRRYEKAGRNEPAPDPKHLTFVNLKAAKEAKPSIQLPSPQELVNAHEPNKTPYQLIQERLAREKEHRLIDNTDSAGVTASNDTPWLIDFAETSPPQSENGRPQNKNDRSGDMIASKPVPDVAMSSEAPLWGADRDPIPNVQQALKETSVSFPDFDQRSGSLQSIPIQDAITDEIAPPTAPASFHNDGRIKDYSDVFATIMIGPACQEVAQVRFRGLDKPSKRLLLGIKAGPRQMHIKFTQICTVEDYRAFYHEVNSHSSLY